MRNKSCSAPTLLYPKEIAPPYEYVLYLEYLEQFSRPMNGRANHDDDMVKLLLVLQKIIPFELVILIRVPWQNFNECQPVLRGYEYHDNEGIASVSSRQYSISLPCATRMCTLAP